MHPIVRAAIDMGLKIDVGHGSHFSYKMARSALDAGVVPHTLGADMHGYNTFLPPPPGTPTEHPDDENHPFAGQARFSLSQAMSSMLALGLTLEQVVPMVTSNAARDGRHAGRDRCAQAGACAPTSPSSTTCAAASSCRTTSSTVVIAERLLQPAFCLRAGRRFDATAPILPRAIAA